MKKKNSVCEFADQRSRLLLQNFRESIARQSRISTIRAFKDAVESPAPRFWVSEARAVRIVSLLMRGEDPTQGMLPEKRDMYLEIFRRASHIKSLHPEIPVGDIVFDIINNPAPRFYLAWRTAKKIINKTKKFKNK